MAIQLATRQLKKDQKCLALDFYMLRVVIVILEQITTFEFFLWFTFVLDSILLTFCFIIILYYHAQEQNKTKIMPRINLNHICSHFGDC